MADPRIAELVALSQQNVAANDVLPIADVSASQTKKVEAKALVQAGLALADPSSIDLSKLNQLSATKLGTNALANDAVTFAKFQNVSTDRLLGRVSDGTGDVEQIVFSDFAQSLIDGANAAAARTTLGLGAVATGNTINTALLEGGSVTTAKIASLAVDTAQIADDAITAAKIDDGAVVSAALASESVILGKIASNAVATTNIVDGGITLVKMAANSVASGQIINGNVTEDKLASDSVITAKIADANVTLAKMASNSVGSGQIVDGNVTQVKLASDAVATANIIDGNVTLAKMASGSVGTAQLVDSGITQVKLAASSIGTTQLIDSGVTFAKIAANSVGSGQIIDANVTTVKLASGAVTIDKLSLGDGELSGAVITASSIPSGSYASQSIETSAVKDKAIIFAKVQDIATDKLIGRSSAGSGSVEEISCTSFARTILDDVDAATARTTLGLGTVATGNTINTSLIEDGSVTTAKITDSGITTIKIIDSGVTLAKMASGSVGSEQIIDGSIVTSKLASGSVTVAKLNLSAGDLSGALIASGSIAAGLYVSGSIASSDLANSAVTTAKIVDSGVTLAKMASGSVGTVQIVDGGITTAKLASGAVTIDKLFLGNGDLSGVVITASSIPSGSYAAQSIETSAIKDEAITFTKVQDIATDKLIGRSSAGSGSIEEIDCTNFARTILDDADAATTRATLGIGTVATGNTINTSLLEDGSVTTAKIADASVTAAKLNLAAGDISGSLISSESIAAGTYATGSITTADIADNAVTFAKIQQVATDTLIGRSSAGSGNVESITLTAAGRALLDDADTAAQRTTLGLGALAVQNTVGTGDYDAGSIASADIADGAISSAKIADSGVTEGKIVDGAITTTKLANETISTVKLADGAITAVKIASGAISSERVASGAIISSTIADAAVTTAKIADSGITTSKIASRAITFDKIVATSQSNIILGRISASGGTIEEIACTAAARSILDDTSIADIRATLGLGSLALQNGSFSGASTGTNTGDQTIVLTGDVTGTGTGTFSTTIAANAITTAKLNDGAVTSGKMASGAVAAVNLGDNSASIASAASPTGSGAFIGQQWFNSNNGYEYTWNGTEWQQQAGLNTFTISGDTLYSYVVSYPDAFSAVVTPSFNTQSAAFVLAGPASGNGDAAPTFRALRSDDLPVGTASALGAVSPGTGLVSASGVLNHANSVASGIYYKVTVDEQGHVSSGTTALEASDIPSLNASIITDGTLGSLRIADEAITAAKLANYSVSAFGEAPPAADYIGQFFYNPLEKDLFLWDGNVWNPVGVSIGEIIFAGTYDANLNVISSTTSAGAGAGLTTGQPLPLPSATFNRYYMVVESGGTGTSPAPTTTLQPPDLLLCNGSAWTEVDVSSTYTSQTAAQVSFSPAASLGSTNVQAALEEVSTECRNVNNVASGILAVGYGGTGRASYTKGQILVASGTSALAAVNVGTNGQVLTADSAQAAGVAWVTPASGTVQQVTVASPLSVVSGSTVPYITIASASTSAAGVVQLSNSTSTTSSVLAATSTAVKSAYDLANAALPKAGGTITGTVVIGTTGSLQFQGNVDDGFETTLTAANPTADRTITLPNITGTLISTGDTATVTNAMLAGSIADTKLNTISTAGKVSNSATTATSANTASAIVTRDGSGNFSAGTIFATIDEGTF
jgi:hypothetical protein